MVSKPANNRTILIADSSRDNLNALGKHLKAEGFGILAAIDGKQAFGIIQNKRPHLVLLEAGIPNMDGFDLCRAVKENNAAASVFVIMMSESADGSLEEMAFAAGADDFISKPYRMEELVERIYSVLENRQKPVISPVKSASVPQKRVLLVEDNELNQNYVEAIISDLGFTLDIADNGGTGLENFLTKKYDLVLTDISVPVINGVELTKIIRAKYSKDVPIIAISGHSDKEIIDRCLAAGMTGFVTKPFTARDLKTEINKLFPQSVSEDGWKMSGIADEHESGNRTYNYDHAIEIAKGDEQLLKKWIERFKEILQNAVESVNSCVSMNEYPQKNKIFHELVNYSGYFGIDELRSYIQELNSIQQFSKDKERIGNFYIKIKNELQKVQAYYDGIV
ncbi:MAG: response regulator [Bacteroidota bacterium]